MIFSSSCLQALPLPCHPSPPFYCQSFSTNKIMKEQSELRKSFLNDTQPTSTRPNNTRRTTLAPDLPFTQSTRKSSMAFADLEQPSVLRDERYEGLYEDTLRDTRRVYKYLASEQETAEQTTIKQSIAKVLREAEKESDFNDRFLIKPKLRAKSARTKRNDEKHIGLRQDEREAERRRSFFSNHKKIIGLEEECMLLEYFLKDEDEHRQKTPIAYLASVPHTSRHRRLTPTAREADRLHAAHDQQEYRSLKRRVHLKEEFVERCAAVARKNLTFRRRENFREIEYILQENNRNMMEEGVLLDRTDQERLQLRNNNHLIRLFLRYEFFFAHSRVYEYFTEQCFGRFKAELFAIAPALAMREGDIDRKVAQVMEFKQTKTLHFQDFKEVVCFIDELTKTDLLALFLEKCPKYFEHPADALLKTHEHEIERYMSSHKVKFLLQVIFNTFPDKLIGKKVLPIKLIPSLLKAYGITEKDFDLHHLFHCYHWMQHYDAGLTFEEFYRGSILMGVKGNNWKGIEHLLRKIDVKKYL